MTVKTIEIPDSVYEEYNQTISRSMDFLDEYLGTTEWVNSIDLKALDLEISTQCVCGQLFDEESNYRVVEDMDETDGYSYALKHVIERGVPDEFFKEEWKQEGDHYAETKMSEYLGFNLDDEPIIKMIYEHNGYRSSRDMFMDDDVVDFPSPWEIFTETWITRIEKRKAELGTMA